jgi:CO/xanthine dehydrogenase FAD-binding subunit
VDRVYFEPANLPEALSILALNQNVGIVAGGTDLVVAHRSGKRPLTPSLMAIHRLQELRTVRRAADGTLQIGALTSHRDLETSNAIHAEWTALRDASRLVGSPATRNVGTVGGNVCNASPAMELGSPLLAFDAIIELKTARQSRRLPFGDFVAGPGKTVRRDDELMTAVILPSLPDIGRMGSAYVRLEYRQAMEIAVVGAAVLLRLDEGMRCVDARIALTAVAPSCIRVPEAEAALTGRAVEAGVASKAGERAAAAAKPIDDIRASADYRRAMISVIVQRAIRLAHQRASEGNRASPGRGDPGGVGRTAGMPT